MPAKKNILIVDDNVVNRLVLQKILSDEYTTAQAANGQEAIDIINSQQENISAIFLDLVMPVMDGFKFMELAKDLLAKYNIPVIVTTQSDSQQTELSALSLGAMDFIVKPYNPQIVKHRLYNLLSIKENAILRNTAERDFVTGAYNRETFYQKASQLINDNPAKEFAVICFDMERFKLVNELFGAEKGDQLLKSLYQYIEQNIETPQSIVARLSGDIFAVCTPYTRKSVNHLVSLCEDFAQNYPIDLKLNFKVGVYIVAEKNIPVSNMCDRALIALKTIKNKYGKNYAIYDDTQRSRLLWEQEITAQMHKALENGEFVPYFQPKYNLITGEIVGSEALVRWLSPQKGLLSPGKFIELFERNGFISHVDFYIWECVCRHLKKILNSGKRPLPVSVNASRVDIYNPNLCNYLTGLIDKYNIPPSLLEIEITETSCTENSEQLLEIINKVRSLGFTVQMDDFGSGYSSLNMLSEVPVDVLKLDIGFLKNSKSELAQQRLLNFVISLAKWLNIHTVAEGVETIEQVKFLRSMGYTIGQGYYFAKPMPQEEYERLLEKNHIAEVGNYALESMPQFLKYSEIWDPTSQFSLFFNEFSGALALLEHSGGNTVIIRENRNAYALQRTLPIKESLTGRRVLAYLSLEDGEIFHREIEKMCRNNSSATFELKWRAFAASPTYRWMQSQANVIYSDEEKTVILMEMRDISQYKEAQEQLLLKTQELQTQARKAMQSLVADIKHAQNQEAAQSQDRDSLTGLYTKEIFENTVTDLLTGETVVPGAFMILCANGFENIVATHGENTANKVLKIIAVTLRDSLRSTDIIGRLAKDKFAIYLKNTDNSKMVQRISESICKEITNTIKELLKADISCSVGFTMYNLKPNYTYKKMYNDADAGLFKAKALQTKTGLTVMYS